MSDLKQFQIKSVNWREQLRRNERRTRFVIVAFLLIYFFVGFLIDVFLYGTWFYKLTTIEIIHQLLLFHFIPYATLTMVSIAAIALLITFRFYDRVMLLGTNYKEITAESNDSLDEKKLYNVVEEMKVAAGLSFMPRVFIIEANYMNAFASGYSEKSAMIAITRGLMQKLDRSEMQAVMAHELSHIRHHDIKLTLTTSVLTNIMVIAVDLLFYNILFGNRKRVDDRILFFIILLRYVLPLITVLLTLYLSRTREYMADAGCVELMRDNQPLGRALLKIDADHKINQETYRQQYNKTAHEDVRQASYLYDSRKGGVKSAFGITSLFSTHPSMKSRLAAIGIKD